MRQELYDNRALKIMECAERGRSVKQICRELDLSSSTVRKYGKAYGIQFSSGCLTDDDIRVAYEEGLTYFEAGQRFGLSHHTVYMRARKIGVKLRRPDTGVADQARLDAMIGMYKAGKTLQEIGDLYGLTRERVRQLMTKYAGVTAKNGGRARMAEAKRAEQRRKEEAKYLAEYGFTPEEYRAARDEASAARAAGIPTAAPLNAFYQQRTNATRRGIGWTLKYADWWALWLESGKWNERGRKGDSYVMCRFRDDGPYEIGNVYIATLRHNSTVQPNNPYRKGHPDYEKAMAAKIERSGREPRAARGCDVDGCERHHYANGVCRRHYDKLRHIPTGRRVFFEARAA